MTLSRLSPRGVDPSGASLWRPHGHYVLRAASGEAPFTQLAIARLTWNALGRLAPDAVSAVLMPNHLHLCGPLLPEVELGIHGLSGKIASALGKTGLWEKLHVTPISGPDALRTQIRYHALNPVRKRLCSDPLSWTWSTYRDHFGATADRWISVHVIDHLFGKRRAGLRALHAYCSADPSVDVAGTPPPGGAAHPVALAEVPIGTVRDSVCAALRVDPADISRPRSVAREVFVKLAWEQGWRAQVAAVAALCRVGRQGLYKIGRRGSAHPAALEASRVCLGEPRFREPALLTGGHRGCRRQDDASDRAGGGGHSLARRHFGA